MGDMAGMIPVLGNTTCAEHFQGPAFNLTGAVLFWAVSRCLEAQTGEGIGSMTGGRGIDEFVMYVVDEYYTDSKQVVVVYDESWEINDMMRRLGTTMSKSFVLYFFPMDPELGLRIHSETADHPSHKRLSQPNSFVVFCKDHHTFANVLDLMSSYPWWNIRAKFLILIKGTALLPAKEILTLLESERIFSGIVVTEYSSKDNSSVVIGTDSDKGTVHSANQNGTAYAGLQLAALNPYPPPGQPRQYFVGKYTNGKMDTDEPIFVDKTVNLQSYKLRVCTFEIAPLVIKMEVAPGEFDYTGLEVIILKELAKYINFTYEFYEPNGTQRVGVVDQNGTWNGLIGEVAENRAQIGFGSVFLLDNRESVVDVTDPYDQDKGCFAVPRPEALQHWLGLVLPFSWQVWACFLAMALISGPIFSGITRPLRMDDSISVGRGIMYALGSMVSAQQAPKAKSSSLRAFIIAWLVFCWLSAIIYRVALIVSLTIGPSDYKIDTLEQLARSGLEWGGYEEVLKTFSNTSDRTDQSMFERFVPTTNLTEALDRVAKEGDFAVLEGGKYLQYAAKVTYFNGFSSALHITKECPTTYNVGFVMPIGSPYYDRVNILLRRFQNAGLIDKWLRDIIYEGTLKNPNLRRGRPSYGLSIDHLKLCFVLVLFGNFFGFISCCVETCIAAYHRKKEALKIRRASRMSQATIKSVTPTIVVSDASEDEE